MKITITDGQTDQAVLARILDRLQVLETQRRIDVKRIDQAIEALDKKVNSLDVAFVPLKM